ncbi:hypothetical protein B0H14DRAFT_2562430 [Mycena olivaceomarginata]|nr:hypothetical protein B0H14DRAFT_2562430 [Mycena olivaceomarginata]
MPRQGRRRGMRRSTVASSRAAGSGREERWVAASLLRCAAPLPILVEGPAVKTRTSATCPPGRASVRGDERMRLRPGPIHDQSRPPGFWDESTGVTKHLGIQGL